MSEKGYDRFRIREIRNKISNKQAFTSKLFMKSMEKLANSLVEGSGKKVKVAMQWDTSPSAMVAATKGRNVYINAANLITRSFPTKELKTESLVGFLGHECGHQKYSAMHLRSLYEKGFHEGKMYPRPPVPGSEKESMALEEIKEFLQAGDTAAVSAITDTALCIQNILEDVYVEMRMCDEYPGSIRKGILMNANRHIEKLPTVTQEIQRQDHELTIILNLILGYARAGEINNWEGYTGEYLDCLYDCMEIIDDAVVDVDEIERFRATNQMILKIWDYMKNLIEMIHEREAEKKARSEESAERNESGSEESQPGIGSGQSSGSQPGSDSEESSGSQTGSGSQPDSGSKESSGSQSGSGSEESSDSQPGSGSQWDSASQTGIGGDEDSGNKESNDSQGGSIDREENEQNSGQEEAEDMIKSVFSNVAVSVPEFDEIYEDQPEEVPDGWDGTWENKEDTDEEQKEENQEHEIKEESDEEGSGAEHETLEDMGGTAEEDSASPEDHAEEDLLRELLQLLRENSRPAVTNQEGGRFEGESICEAVEGEGAVWQDHDYEGNGYYNAAEDMNRILFDMAEEKFEKEQEKELIKSIKSQAEHMNLGAAHAACNIEVHRLGNVPAQCKRMYDSLSPDILKFAKRLQEEMWEILYSEEKGMEKNLHMGKKIDRSRLYRQDKRIFMRARSSDEERQAAIAVLIDESASMAYSDRITYGRLTALIIYDVCVNLGIPVIVYGHSTSYDSLFTEETVDMYAYAEFESIDGKDRYRIMDMSPRGANRDGAAIRFVAERLNTRPEDLKLLFLVSDGQPSGLYYDGDLAKEDLQSLKGELKREGIMLFAAAIGDDRNVIEEIYQDGFLNISDLSMLPVRITQKIVSYLR